MFPPVSNSEPVFYGIVRPSCPSLAGIRKTVKIFWHQFCCISDIDKQATPTPGATVRIFGLVITVLLLCSCSSLPQGQDIADPAELSTASAHPPLLFYTERLADQLFHKLQPLESGAIAVTTFADVQLMAPDTSRNSSYNVALQLQESMQTVATQLGYQVSELRLNDAVLVHAGYENSLGRNVNSLVQNQQARYLITGTLTEGEEHITVNAKLIDLRSQHVVAAASSVIPVDVLWPNEQLQLRHNKLYRNSES